MADFSHDSEVSHAINEFLNWFYREESDYTVRWIYDVLSEAVDGAVKGEIDIKHAKRMIIKELESKELADIAENLILALKDSVTKGLDDMWNEIEMEHN